MGGFFNAKCKSTNRLDGKTAIVTGSNTGIGKCTVRDFYRRGARVIMACRSIQKAEAAANELLTEAPDNERYLMGEIAVVELDLTDLESVRMCANKILLREKRINLLINNAGIMFCPESRTKDEFEMQFGTNHLGHFLFTLLLLPKIIESSPSRIVNVSSLAHTLVKGPFRLDDLNWEKRPYNSTRAYYQSKLANVLFTKELAKRLKDAKIEGVTTYALHPGVIATELFRHTDDTLFKGALWVFNNVASAFLKSPEEGAQTTIHCAVDDQAGFESGLYYTECKVKESSSKSKNIWYAQKLWELSSKMVRLEDDYNPFASKAV